MYLCALARVLAITHCVLSPHLMKILASQEPELAEPINRADLVIFLDATVSLPPGRIRLHSNAPTTSRPGAFAHSATPELALAKQLL